MTTWDVTSQVRFRSNGNPVSGLSITKCVCGQEFEPREFNISVFQSHPCKCSNCGINLFFSLETRIYQVQEKDVTYYPANSPEEADKVQKMLDEL